MVQPVQYSTCRWRFDFSVPRHCNAARFDARRRFANPARGSYGITRPRLAIKHGDAIADAAVSQFGDLAPVTRVRYCSDRDLIAAS